MGSLVDFLTGRAAQRMAISACMFWICYSVGQGTDSYVPWLIILLYWTGEFLAWQDGVFQGAYGFHKMAEVDKAKAIKLFQQLEKDSKEQ